MSYFSDAIDTFNKLSNNRMLFPISTMFVGSSIIKQGMKTQCKDLGTCVASTGGMLVFAGFTMGTMIDSSIHRKERALLAAERD